MYKEDVIYGNIGKQILNRPEHQVFFFLMVTCWCNHCLSSNWAACNVNNHTRLWSCFLWLWPCYSTLPDKDILVSSIQYTQLFTTSIHKGTSRYLALWNMAHHTFPVCRIIHTYLVFRGCYQEISIRRPVKWTNILTMVSCDRTNRIISIIVLGNINNINLISNRTSKNSNCSWMETHWIGWKSWLGLCLYIWYKYI